jgi:hypothetical protein
VTSSELRPLQMSDETTYEKFGTFVKGGTGQLLLPILTGRRRYRTQLFSHLLRPGAVFLSCDPSFVELTAADRPKVTIRVLSTKGAMLSR